MILKMCVERIMMEGLGYLHPNTHDNSTVRVELMRFDPVKRTKTNTMDK